MKFKTITILFIVCLVNTNKGLLNAQTNDYINSLNSYSFDLYREINIGNENILLSPLSTYYALLVAYEGSKNKTKQEFEKVLYLGNQGSLKNDFIHNNAGKSDSCSFYSVSNAIWVDKSVKIDEVYRNSVEHKYLSDFEQTDFTNANLAVSNINGWVSEKTNRRINEIVSSANINSETKMLISNAVYFKGEWLNKFEKQKTISAPFFTSVENQYKVDFMNMTENLQYFENDEYQFISKPYKSSDISFCIILPKKLFGIEEIEKKLNTDFFKETLDSTYSAKTLLSIPKLKLESSSKLKDALKNVGLKTAFTEEADFSGITKGTPLMLSQVLHKTWIELDEEKTEAAAATSAVVLVGAGRPSYVVFNADHPFVFFILDNRSGAIIFMGRYIKPTDGEKIVKEDLTKNLENRMQEKFSTGNGYRGPLYVVDKKVITEAELKAINPKDIESMEVLKKKEEISKYSTGKYDGVIIITLKKKKNRKGNYDE
jgi:serpin B